MRAKKTDSVQAERQRKIRAEHRRQVWGRFWGNLKFIALVIIFIFAFLHRVEIQKFAYKIWGRVITKNSPLSTEIEQQGSNYENEVNGITK